MFKILFVSFFVSFFQLSSFAQYGIDPDKLGKVKVEIKIPKDFSKNFNVAQKDYLKTQIEILEKTLFVLANDPETFKHVSFKPTQGQLISMDDLYKAPNDDEIPLLGGEKLSEEQLASIGKTGTFAVPSQKYPGQFYVWRVSAFFQKGIDNIRVTFKDHIAHARRHLIIGLPERILGTRQNSFSIARGLMNLTQGLTDAVSLIVGLKEDERRYNNDKIEEMISQYRTESVLTAITAAKSRGEPTPDDRLYDEKLMEKATEIVEVIYKELGGDKHYGFYNVDELYRRVLESPEIEKLSPGLGQLIVNHGREIEIISAAEAGFAKEIADFAELKRQELIDLYKLSGSELKEKVNEASQRYRATRLWDVYDAIPGLLSQAGLQDNARLLAMDLDALKAEQARVLVEQKASERRASGAISFPYRLWKFEVAKTADPTTGEEHFYKKEYGVYNVKTDQTAWRLSGMYHSAKWALNNGLYQVLVENMWYGPFGLKAFFSANPFEYEWVVDPETGEVGPTTVWNGETEVPALRQTLWSKVENQWAIRQQKLDDFEKNKGGWMPPLLTRLKLGVTADFWNGFAMPTIIGTAQTGLTAGNLAITTAITATSIVWAPLSSLVASGFRTFLYDYWGTKYHHTPYDRSHADWVPAPTRKLPILSALLMRAGIGGAVEAGVGVTGLVYHPASAAAHGVVSAVRSGTRIGWDALMMQALKRFAKVPEKREQLGLDLMHGPGLSNTYFYQIDSGLAALAVQASMEKEELARYERAAANAIRTPKDNLEILTLIETGLLGSAIATENGFGGAREIIKREKHSQGVFSEKQREVRELLEALTKLPKDKLGSVVDRIKFATSVEKERALKMGAVESQRYYEGKLFPTWTAEEIALFWREAGLKANDWVGLAQKHLTGIFGESVLVTLDESDKTLRIEVPHGNLGDLIKAIEQGITADDLNKVIIVRQDLPQKPSKSFYPLTPHGLCRPYLTQGLPLVEQARNLSEVK